MAKKKSVTLIEQSLFIELSELIEQSQQQVFSHANSTLTLLFWRIGQRINDEILKRKRGEYVKQIVSTLSTELKSQYGRNFEITNLRRMIQFAEQFTCLEIERTFGSTEYLELLNTPCSNEAVKDAYFVVTRGEQMTLKFSRSGFPLDKLEFFS
ncbi:MAG: hypothetical protein J7623_13400 [Chitinophaga sp.]|uniref:DUF1016 N-terminal domain-containing protein n=1 Tax=Chitinophaga sp. TaxID=1869181 RepID=UPI001B0384AB|nr:DUF1016 N-terminal domain-containing protein [Chitinophaga sp.]MBO9729627.1 hypothetical protein [Chitinophaga sp.]